MIGLDVAERASTASRAGWGLLLVGVVMLVALCLAALRVEILRARYELGELARAESTLLAERDALRVEVRALRHPDRLARLARELGFAPPERVIDLRPGARP